MNGGQCIDKVAGYQCDCLPGFDGKRCELNRNGCSDACMYSCSVILLLRVEFSALVHYCNINIVCHAWLKAFFVHLNWISLKKYNTLCMN